MDENRPVTAQTPREDSFDIAVRGFNRQQVLEYMSRNNQLVARLEQQLATARAEADHSREALEEARREAETLRGLKPQAKPVHAEVSDRLSQILRLAAEEADQERATADAEIATLRSESKAESERLLTEAREEAERRVSQSREIAEAELAQARQAAEDDLRAAREEAERLRSLSEQQASELIDDAQRRAGAVNEVSEQRLETLTATHGEAVLRLGQIRDVLADLLDRDVAAGSLAQVVDAVMGPARPEIDTRSELEGGTGENELIERDEPVVVAVVEEETVEASPAGTTTEEAVADTPGIDDDEKSEDDEKPEDDIKSEDDVKSEDVEKSAGGKPMEETQVVPAVDQTVVHEPIDEPINRGGSREGVPNRR